MRWGFWQTGIYPKKSKQTKQISRGGHGGAEDEKPERGKGVGDFGGFVDYMYMSLVKAEFVTIGMEKKENHKKPDLHFQNKTEEKEPQKKETKKEILEMETASKLIMPT